MAFITWNDSYSVGVSSIDNQHKKLCDLVNQLHDAMGAGKGTDIVGSIIAETVKYTQQHFAYEENYMKSINYPLLSQHKLLHQKLIAEVADLQKKVTNKERINVIATCQFLKDWLTSHILKEDKKYSQNRQPASV